MSEERCQGLILQCKELRESDLLVGVWTDAYGRMVLRAPGAKRSKRRFAGLLQTFTSHELAFRRTRGAWPVLLHLTPKELREGLGENLEAFAAISYAAELALRLTQEEDPNVEFFALLETFFAYCETHSPLSHKAFCRFHLRLFELLGLQPDWFHCLECGKSLAAGQSSYFDLAQGGALCDTCPPAHASSLVRLSGASRALLDSLQRKLPTDPSTAGWAPLVELLDGRVKHLLGAPAQSRAFLQQMIAL